MRRTPILALVLATAVLTPPAPAAAADPRRARVGLARVHTGLASPVGMAYVPGTANRYVIVERAGRLRMVRDGVLRSTPFLDIRSRVKTSGEAGLLSVAFPPGYARTGYFFVAYVHTDGTLRISRFRANPTSDIAGTAETNFLTIAHPTYDNHYGGQVAFGPYGYLYVSTGDGGGSGDPAGNAQNLRSLLGKLLRIDVTRGSAGKPYTIPSTNPYATSTIYRREIFASGLRNPWKFSFDRADASLYLGDVGQYVLEEIDWLSRGIAGRNFGWDCREGTINTTSTFGGRYCSGKSFTAPVRTYNHDYGCAVIGGHVYRGTRYKSLLDGIYLYGDYCSGRIWGLTRTSTGGWISAQMADWTGNIVAFGQDKAGEVYVLSAAGDVHRVTAAAR